MEREEALLLLKALEGNDLVLLAQKHGQKIFHEKELEGKIKRTINKGWAGLTLERALGLPVNSRREPNGGSWELKQVSLKKHKKTGAMTAKETMQITMFDRQHIIEHPFEDSHVIHKIERMVVVARLYVDRDESESKIIKVCPADLTLDVGTVYEQVRRDYENIRTVLKEGGTIKSEMGKLIQSRTKGAGHGSTSRAWYARTQFVNLLLGIEK